MVHADASTFQSGNTKKEAYAQVLEQAKALFEGQRNWVCNLSNTSSLLYHALHSLPLPSSAVNWCGFYVLDPSIPSSTSSTGTKPAQLILGPFQGMVACQTILFGKGVCGTAAETGRTQVVRDVEKFEGHIACDGRTKSEIVVPVIKGGTVVAIIDIDCAELDGFDEEDRMALEELAELLTESCDF